MKNTKRPAGNRKSRKAFTLIELLVVIAIIALLAAILFPVFGRARENARRSACASNMKQIALGVMQYTQDYDENFPVGSNASGGRGNGWAGQIYPYIKSSQVFTCPDDSSMAGGQNLTISYAMNQSIVWAAPGCSATAQLSAFSAPSLTTMFFEVENCIWFPADDAPKPTYCWISSPTGNGGASYPNLSIGQSTNGVYATGYFNGITSGSVFTTAAPLAGIKLYLRRCPRQMAARRANLARFSGSQPASNRLSRRRLLQRDRNG